MSSPSVQLTAPPRASFRGRRLVLGIAIVSALLAVLVKALSGTGGGVLSSSAAARDARAFLRDYVNPDGRVVRRDQGGDTVSEGQAYGMLLAESIGDQVDFARIWSWTHAHLQLPDGLLGYLADPSGTMRNPQAASDADVLAAWALSRASAPRAAAYHAQARLIARAILGHEMVSRGRLLMLAAGPWATGSPVSLDPSYWSPVAFDALARFTHDARWAALTRSAESLSAALTSGGKTLPPDWARVDGTVATPTAAPNGEARQVQYGLDAQRLVVWLAASCDAAARRLAASWWKLLAPTVRAGALALSPAGSILNSQTNATPLVAAAAAATAAGRSAERDRLLDAADRVQSSHPTYYGAAWLALGRTLLTTAALGGCATRTGS